MPSLTFEDQTSSSRFSFNPLTGELHYLPPRASLPARVWHGLVGLPWWVRLLVAGGSVWVIIECSRFVRWRIERNRLRQRMREANEVDDLAALVYALAQRKSGGFMTNAHVTAVESDPSDSSKLFVFASGGWAGTPHSLTGLPMYPYPLSATDTSQVADVSQQRNRWWRACAFGRSRILNGSLAFILAMKLLEQESDIASKSNTSNKRRPLLYRGRRVVNVGLCNGSLYNNVHYLPKLAAHAASERKQRKPSSSAASFTSSTSASSFSSSSDSSLLPSRLELICELGAINHARLAEYQQQHWGYSPDPLSHELPLVADMSTRRILDWFHSHTQRLPTKTLSELDGVIWERRMVPPPREQECWLWIEVETQVFDPNHTRSKRPSVKTERIHIDLANYFSKGIDAGYRDLDGETGPSDSGDGKDKNGFVATLTSSWERLCSTVNRSWTSFVLRLPPSIATALTPTSSSTSSSTHSFSFTSTPDTALAPLSSMPFSLTLSDTFVTGSRALNARINDSASSPRDVIAMLQRQVLINSQPPNPTHTQLRSILLESLRIAGNKTKYLVHRIEADEKTAAAGASHTRHVKGSTGKKKGRKREGKGKGKATSSQPAQEDYFQHAEDIEAHIGADIDIDVDIRPDEYDEDEEEYVNVACEADQVD